MRYIVIALYTIIIIVLAVATFIEHAKGSEYVADNVYHTWWFVMLWMLLTLTATISMMRRRLWKRPSAMALHASLIMILLGAMVTYTTGERGMVHLREGVRVNSFIDDDDGAYHEMPFELEMDSFRVVTYPGTNAAADYVTFLSDGSRVSMNNVLTREGYRFYQSSYDADMRGSLLSVNHDPLGTALTYAGYVMLFISMMWTLMSSKGGFRRLLTIVSRDYATRTAVVAALLTLTGMTVSARSLPTFNRMRADSVARQQVIYNDRVAPLGTMAHYFVTKLYGKPDYQGLTSVQVVGGWMLRPDAWKDEPMIKVKSGALRKELGLTTQYATFAQLFNGTEYRVASIIEREERKGAQGNSALKKAVIELDEKVGLLLMLQQGTLFSPLPRDGSVTRLPEWRVTAELTYNKLASSSVPFMLSLTVGMLSFVLLLYTMTHDSSRLTSHGRLMTKRMGMAVNVIALLLALHMALCFVLRWVIGGHIPLSNGYETMQFMSLAVLVLGLLMAHRFMFVIPFSLLMAGFAMLVAHLGQMNPQLTPLMPVLVSPWLSLHVSVIMIAYALLSLLMMVGVTALCVTKEAQRLMHFSQLLLYPAVFLLGVGIFLGAVWANQSWGSYWTWDPKEVWALITFMVYGASLHTSAIGVMQRPRVFHTLMIVSFALVLMTYFGVNYLLGGMHSYA